MTGRPPATRTTSARALSSTLDAAERAAAQQVPASPCVARFLRYGARNARRGIKSNGNPNPAHPMTQHERIEIDPEIMGGKPVIRGTRVPVEIVLRKLGAGMTAEAIISDHPRLTSEDIRAAQAFAADYLADEALVYG
jgi:uncharacterized protein (DUF433 family)